ncbi:MAG: N-6 DNA methylase [Chloroflexota bacterium]|nr:N-6 DNA methylase [Chloroflexota bacterium]
MRDMFFYTNKQPADERKLRGGFYTPVGLASYLVNWGIRSDTKRILEPCCGDGNFIIAIQEKLREEPTMNPVGPLHVVAVEVKGDELQTARARAQQVGGQSTTIEWMNQDYFAAYSELTNQDRFDLVVGNPPFIRFQYFEEGSRELAFDHLRGAGYKPSKLDNAWVAFVELSIELLRSGGRLAMVVPGELLQVKYAKELRGRLASQFEHIVLIGFRRLVFPHIQQEVFLLLAEGKQRVANTPSDIHTLEFTDGAELLRAGNLREAVTHVPARHSRNGMKWTSLFIDETAFLALDEAEKAKGLSRLGQLAEVDVGIVTGRNSFFILDEEQKNELGVSRLTLPVIGRTSALRATTFTAEDFDSYKRRHPCFLLNLDGIDSDGFPERLVDYLEWGEREQVHQGYKCRIRKRWFDVPSVYAPDLFLFRQIHRYPLLVVNGARATCTDTIHRVRQKEGIDSHLLATVSFNSLTLAWAEVCGRSYGGGVLELEPREAEELPVPYHSTINVDVEKVDSLLRTGRSLEALDCVDSVVLKRYLGFDQTLIGSVRRAWEQLRDRRLYRNGRLWRR